MVLKGLLGGSGGLFDQSDETGVGLNPNPIHQIQIDAGEGIVIFSKASKGTTSSTVESTFDSIKFAAGDLNIPDIVNVKIFLQQTSATAVANIKLVKEPGTKTIKSINTASGDVIEFLEFNITEDMADNTFAIYSRTRWNVAGTGTHEANKADMTTANWFSGEWTLNFKGKSGTTDETLNWSWSVTVIKGAR